jgi:hypothetical protein
MYNFMANLMNTGKNMSKFPLYPSMKAKVDFYIFMIKEGQAEKHFM